MAATDRILTRRTFLTGLGHGTVAIAVVSLAACGPTSSTGGVAPPTVVTSSPLPPETVPPGSASATASADAGAGAAVAWQRVNLGFVSAYVLVRAGEAAIVYTGTAGSEGAIEAALGEQGLGWDAVGHVILTHLHQDHAGSSDAVLSAAADATGYAGAADLAGIAAPRPLTAVGDGDRVFDLRIVATPGHTPGSICVLDEVGGILVAGDALRVEGGQPALPGAGFTDDMDEAIRSVATLGGLTFETLLVGHGEPIEAGASSQVAALAGN
jgi:glyoxylase-like metal-dependent hydrolase (beta-lactamase superfamily II)